MTVLITGGAGYIGSHTCLALLEAGLDIVVVDNYCNSNREALARVTSLANKDFPVVEADINDAAALNAVFTDYAISAVIHFAGLKAVGESTEVPLVYYRNNLAGTLTLCEVMKRHNCGKLVFSSSATVYGDPERVPILETDETQATNPYGRSKLMVEQILTDLQMSEPSFWNITLLRYFNPIGAHPSGKIGEDPNGIPNNLLPFVAQVASGKLQQVRVFGNDYDTADGTGVRDYIHVVDVAVGHLKAIEHLNAHPNNLHVFNLGTGQGYSVMEVIKSFRQISKQEIPYEVRPRRPGDIATCYADPGKAQRELGWKSNYTLKDMITHTWQWQSQNPKGYQT